MTNDEIDIAQKLLSGICPYCNLLYAERGHNASCCKQMQLDFGDEDVTWSDIKEAETLYWR